MAVENKRIYSNSCRRVISNHFNQRRIWLRCPRCIGGNMYHEDNGEYVCMQCGCSFYPDKVAQTQKVAEVI